MLMKQTLFALAALLLVPLASLHAAEATAAKPNIIFILADDLGYMDVGCFNPKTFYETPHIDLLARRGMRFTQGYAACCVCSPTRGSIMTGKYPPRFGITNFIPGLRSGKLKSAPNADHLALEEVTIAEALRDGGYNTFFAGKWHLGGGEFYPGAQGFPKELDSGNAPKAGAQFWYPKSELSSVPVILAGGAAIMAVGGIVFFHEPASWQRLLGVGLAIAGLFLLRR